MKKKLPHIFLKDYYDAVKFTSPPMRGGAKKYPKRDRYQHYKLLQGKFDEAWQVAKDDIAKNEQVVHHIAKNGVYLEFRGEEGYELATKSLENLTGKDPNKQIQLLNTRTRCSKDEEKVEYATIFIPHSKKNYFVKKLNDYAEKTKNGKPVNQKLIESISEICYASKIDSFWCSSHKFIPQVKREWCEIWLRTAKSEKITHFKELLKELNIDCKSGQITFPERTVIMAKVNKKNMEDIVRNCDDIAEFRYASTVTSFWTNLDDWENDEWIQDLLDRLIIKEGTTAVCILDHGVNNGHGLLKPILKNEDCQTVNSSWGVHDHHRWEHGTSMAGIVGYGNLSEHLSGNNQVSISHCLESVKILPQSPKENPKELWGYITSQGISLAEIQAPHRNRIVCMAITCPSDCRHLGFPDSWSASLDQISSNPDEKLKRLIIVSAGNTDENDAKNYPHIQITNSIQSPAQSWNALTVGAYTCFDKILDPKYTQYETVAPKGGISPFTTTSSIWEDKWPIKPEIVMEGGNLGKDNDGNVTQCSDLSLLSTHSKHRFAYFNMTSAATAEASWLAAQVQSQYPHLWPETVRGIIVHSASWSETMKKQFLEKESKVEIKSMMRICGYGVPNLAKALHSASNSLTLISQSEIQPFEKVGSKYKTKDMHFYNLPWPKDELLNLPDDASVSMRITLSYFIEPSPENIGWNDRYTYASHGLRFDINAPGESQDDFIKKVNAAQRNEDENYSFESTSEYWLIGSKARDRGSIHSDIWQGTAAELASSNMIAVHPKIGWWRKRTHLGKWANKTRYSLIVSIQTSEQNVDIYTPIVNKVGVVIET